MRNTTSFLLLLAGLTFSLNLPLAVKNSIAEARAGVPVQVGIPFPQGKLQPADVAKLTVSEEATGLVVPAGVVRTVSWHDGSVRWVRALFPATLAASSTKNYVLSDADQNTPGGLTATALNNTVTVSTGPLKFTVKGANFNLIDEAWMNEGAWGTFGDPQKVVEAGNAGGFVIKVAGVEHKSNTVTATVTLVEASKFHALIKATGKVSNYPFTVYYYAYYGKPYLKIVHNYFYDTSDNAAMINIGDISLRLMTKVTGGNAAFSGTAADVTTSLAAGDEGLLYYVDEDSYVVRKGSTTLNSGLGVTATLQGAKNMGWAHVVNGGLGVGTAMRWMWEMAPKHLSLKGTGEAGIHFYSSFAAALPFNGGAGRTHFAGIAFTTSTAAVKEMFYSLTQPLVGIAPTRWLTWQTRVMGDLAPLDLTLLDPAYSPTQFAPAMINQYKAMGFIHGHNDRLKVLEGENAYGFLQFGDLDDPRGGSGCSGKHWATNYYDFPHNIAQAFMVTGSDLNLETGFAHAVHLCDMDHNSTTGQSRTGPGYMANGFGDYQTCAIGYSGTANHYKTQGMYDWSNILAEPMLGDIGLRVAKWAEGYPGGEIRAVGHVLEALSSTYGYTNDPKWKTLLEGAWTRYNLSASDLPSREQCFQQAYVGEGLMWSLVELPNHQPALNALQTWADYWSSRYTTAAGFGDPECKSLKAGFFPGIAYAASLLPAKRAAYMTILRQMWTDWLADEGKSGDGRLKTFTQKFKGPPHFFKEVLKTGTDLNSPDYWALPAPAVSSVEAKKTAANADLMRIHPNPMRGTAQIAVSLASREAGAVVRIYDVRGSLVRNWPVTGAAGQYIAWDGRDGKGVLLGSGIYIVELRNREQSLKERVSLIR